MISSTKSSSSVTGGLPQESRLVSSTFIDDLDEWTRGSTLNRFADGTKLAGVVAAPDGHGPQEAGERSRKNSSFSRGKCQVLPLGKNSPRYQYMLGHLESSFAEKNMGVLANTKGNAASKGGHQPLGLHWKYCQQVEWGDASPLLSTDGAQL